MTVYSRTMIAVDLFAGAGNASQGLHEAGYDVVGYEYWPVAQRSHESNHLPCRLHDLSDPARDHEIPEAPLFWASPPCQPFSAAGDGEGEFDDRDGFPWLLRILALRRPPVVIVENVRGLVFERHQVYFHGVLNGLRRLGYDVQWKVLNSADYGVPQTRERVFIVGRLDGGPITWPTVTHTEEPGLFTEQWISMADALGWGFNDDPARTIAGNRSPRWLYEGNETTGRTVVGFPRRSDGNGEVLEVDGVEYRERDLFDAEEPAPTVTEKGRSWNRYVLNTGLDWKKDGDRDDAQKIPLTDPAPAVTTKSAQQWQVRAGKDANATIRPIDEPAPTVLARKEPNGWTLERPATTITADQRVFQPGRHDPDVPGQQSQNAIRVTIPELAKLQDFVDGWVFHGTRTDQARQVGNACPRRLTRLLAEANRPRT
jgi:DNA (cytosine-5)-methyltransferase 1